MNLVTAADTRAMNGCTKLTVRQAKMFAKKADGPFSCFIDAPNGYYGLSTVVVLWSKVYIMAPHKWDAAPKGQRHDRPVLVKL